MKLEERKAKKAGKKRKRLIFRISILLVLVAAVVFVLVSNGKDGKALYREGDQAPDFKLSQVNDDVKENTVKLSDLKGKGVMINFWATYCKPCEKEMPYMQGLYEEYKDKGIEVIAVNLDANELVVDRFIDKHHLSFPVLRDEGKQVRELYNIRPIPSSLFIDANGKIIERVEGQLTLGQLEGHLKAIQP